MDRARIHEGIRRMRFTDILGRSERSELSQMEAAELLGISERTFRRWRVPVKSHRLLCSATKISRIETAGRKASLRDVRKSYAMGDLEVQALAGVSLKCRPGWVSLRPADSGVNRSAAGAVQADDGSRRDRADLRRDPADPDVLPATGPGRGTRCA